MVHRGAERPIAFRFVHTADLHLDSPLRTLALRDPDVAAVVGNASRKVFESIVSLCLDDDIDALLIAGDLYDGDLRSVKTAAFLTTQLRRLHEGGVRVFMIRGNHDAEAAAITRQLDLPDSVHVFTGRGGTVQLEEAGVAIHGVSFAEKRMPHSSLPKYKTPVPGMVNIGLMHTSIGATEGHDVYAPVSVSDLVDHGYDYWALGHIHRRSVHHENPFIVMPGIPQGRDIGEAGTKSITIGTVDEAGLRIEERATSVAEFSAVTVDIAGAETIDDVRQRLSNSLREAAAGKGSDHAILRLTLAGQTPLAWRLRRDGDQRLAEAREEAAAIGSLSIESLDIRAEPDAAPLATGDPLAELQAMMMDEVTPDPGFRSEAMARIATLVAKLPPSLRDHFGEDEAARAAVLDRLLGDGCLDVSAALHEMARQED